MFDKSNNPHEFTEEEMLIKFLKQLKSIRNYWAKAKLDPERDNLEERMDGLCFSFLSLLDGCQIDMPAFEVVPTPHPSDEEYLRDEGCDWWPNQAEKLKSQGFKTVSGGHAMHELWHAFNRGELKIVDGKLKVDREQ